ncbi:MAG: penicillin-insensitive murein endopeptidase [Pseudomonadota bacterium]
MVKILYPCALILALVACGPSSQQSNAQQVQTGTSDAEAKPLFRAQTTAGPGPAQTFGRHARGCVTGAVELPETGPTWQAMRLSRDKNWGQPITIDYIQDLSRRVAQLPGWDGLYVGDLGLPRGGPNRGHASHQSGLDVDIWMLPPSRLNLTANERENISSITMQRANGAYVNNSWTEQHREMIKMAASDPRVDRIFIFAGGKVDLCNWAGAGDRDWLRKVRPWWGHHYHYHVRLNCPPGQPFCRGSAPLPPGDGCGWANEWVDTRILNPPPPDPNAPPRPPRKEITLADMPAQCSALVGR